MKSNLILNLLAATAFFCGATTVNASAKPWTDFEIRQLNAVLCVQYQDGAPQDISVYQKQHLLSAVINAPEEFEGSNESLLLKHPWSFRLDGDTLYLHRKLNIFQRGASASKTYEVQVGEVLVDEVSIPEHKKSDTRCSYYPIDLGANELSVSYKHYGRCSKRTNWPNGSGYTTFRKIKYRWSFKDSEGKNAVLVTRDRSVVKDPESECK